MTINGSKANTRYEMHTHSKSSSRSSKRMGVTGLSLPSCGCASQFGIVIISFAVMAQCFDSILRHQWIPYITRLDAAEAELGTSDFPATETSLVDGEIAFRQHSGGHTDGPNWGTR